MPGKTNVGDILQSDCANGVLFVVFVPSKDKDGGDLPKNQDQQMWASAAGDMLTDLFVGATQMPPAEGKWFNDETKKIITEPVVLVHSYASEKDANDASRLKRLAKFLHRMGKATNQGEVVIVIDNVMHRIKKFPLAETGK